MKEQVIALAYIALFAACMYESRASNDAGEWRPLKSSELAQQHWRAASSTNFAHISLDINGDHVPDEASLVVSNDTKQSGIKVCYGTGLKRQAENCIVIAVEANVAEIMGLEKRKPGCYEYIEDDNGMASNGKLACSKNDILGYFRFGSAGSFFIYDCQSNFMKRFWDTD